MLKNAGEVLIGPYTPFCIGNYCVGTNACLPKGGFVHTFSCTTVYDFLKHTGIAYVTAEGYGSFHIPHYRFRLPHYGLEKLTASWRLAPPIA